VSRNLIICQPDVQFSWSDCGTASSLVHVSAVSVAPSPLVFPGNVTLGFTANVLVDLPSVISVSMSLLCYVSLFTNNRVKDILIANKANKRAQALRAILYYFHNILAEYNLASVFINYFLNV